MINIRNISLFGGLFAIVVIALGAWTRLVDAGLGCPDWPGCYGFVTFPITDSEIALAESRYPTFPYEIDKAIPEVVHRYFAAMLGLIAIFLVFFAIRYKVDSSLRIFQSFYFFYLLPRPFWLFDRKLKAPSYNSYRPSLWWFITLSLFFFIFLKAADFRFLNYIDIKKYRYLALVCLIVLLVQIFLGAWTSTNYASLACPDFPTCQGSYYPEMDFESGFNLKQEVGPNYLYGLLENPARVAIHYSHRVTALALTFFMLILIGCLWFTNAAPLSSTLGLVLLLKFPWNYECGLCFTFVYCNCS